ncbi:MULTISPECIES: hypothetical protein [Streptomyces]|uniref:Uncharacterized protein n=1 Tax=Streptomyces achmelvichensis TaxID=3134111 RepID=A0ACC6Q3J0_9ACTN|nr:hypothetical protein OG317_26985 [Streptomyces sp. NBC_01167]
MGFETAVFVVAVVVVAVVGEGEMQVLLSTYFPRVVSSRCIPAYAGVVRRLDA